MGYDIQQGNTTEPLLFNMVLTVDHVTPATGLVPTVLLSKNGFPFGAALGAVTEVGLGVYSLAPNATDADTLGPLLLHASAAGADVALETFDVVEAPAVEPLIPGDSLMVSAGGIIRLALQSIGKHASGEPVPGELQQDSFTVLNEMLDNWKTQRLLVPQLTRVEYTLAPGTSTLTIGPGGDIDMERPYAVRYAFIRDASAPSFDRPISVLTDDALANRVYKTNTEGYVREVYYTPGAALGTLTIPSTGSSSTLVLYVLIGLPRFSNVSTPYLLMPGYAKALRYNLAVQLAPFHGRQPSNFVYSEASSSIADIKRLNIRHRVLTNYFNPGGGNYDIYSDETRA